MSSLLFSSLNNVDAHFLKIILFSCYKTVVNKDIFKLHGHAIYVQTVKFNEKNYKSKGGTSRYFSQNTYNKQLNFLHRFIYNFNI